MTRSAPHARPEPFQSFLDEHGAAVLAFLRAMVGPVEADDCFQETFIAALRGYGSLDGPSPRAWVLAIARNKTIDHHRAAGRQPRLSASDLPEAPAPAPAEPDPELWREVAALPERQRAAVALRYAADLRYREIAQAMGTTAEAARRSVHEGLKKLRERLTEEER